MIRDERRLAQALEWVVAFEDEAVLAWVARQRRLRPGDGAGALARRAFGRARLKATFSGIVSGLPGNPLFAAPAAAVDVAVVLRVHTLAAARVACIAQPSWRSADDPLARWALLVPVLGIELEDAPREGGERSAATRRYLKKKGLKILKKLVLKDFGKRVAARATFGRSVPVLGAAIGGVWNFHEVARIRDRTLSHFGLDSSADPERLRAGP